MFINQKGVPRSSLLIPISRIPNGFLFIGFDFYYYYSKLHFSEGQSTEDGDYYFSTEGASSKWNDAVLI